MTLRIERVTDEAGARLWHSINAAMHPLDHAGLPGDPLDDLLGMLPDGTATERIEWYLGFDADRLVAISDAYFPLKENRNLANVWVGVAHGDRRRGFGREMAAHVLARVREDDRSITTTFVGGPIGELHPGDELASVVGAKPALSSICRQLRITDVDHAELEAILEERVRPKAIGYDVVQWVDVAPVEHVDGAAELLPHVFMDSPRGDLEFEDEVWDGPRYREYEADVARRGRRLVASGAVERATGRLVAYTDITVPRGRPEAAGQWGTIVEHDHRGHRLGLLVKIENLHLLMREFPAVERIQTWNAEENTHMIAVNELIGFRPIERYQAWQLNL